ncbi:hypothetical protein [Amnibacterium kyonggiense]
MKRWLVALLVAGVVCAAVGVALNGDPFDAPSFGWTAYAPLAHSAYEPVNLTWLSWSKRIGLILLASGAGSTGAAISALAILRRPEGHGTERD